MTRLIRIGLPLVLSLAVGAILAEAQTQPVTSQKASQVNADTRRSQQGSRNFAAQHKTSSHTRNTVARKGKKRPEYRPELSGNSVEVINGDSARKVVFHDDQTAASAKKGSVPSRDASAPMKVEVVNGAYTDTQYLYNNGEDQRIEAQLNRPVVVGVQSSDTRIAGGNKHLVVTRVNTSGSGDAKAVSSGGQPVTRSISPQPKRPAYQPDQQ